MNHRAKLGIAALVLLALVVGLPLSAHYRAKRKVAAYRQQLRAGGEKLTIPELRPKVPPDALRNAHALLYAAGGLGGFNYSCFAPTVKVVVPGRALVAWQQAELPTPDATNVWPGLSQMVAQNEEPLGALHAALAAPKPMFDLDYELVFSPGSGQAATLQLAYLSTVKGAAQWLAQALILDLHADRLTNAWGDVQALSALVAHGPNEPLMISVLVHVAIGSIALNATWEALQSPTWREEQLRELQANWESVDLLAQAEAALAMERPFFELSLAHGRRSYSTVPSLLGATGRTGMGELAEMGKKLLENPQGGLKEFAHRYPGYWAWRWWQSYDDELVILQSLQAAIATVQAVRQHTGFVPATRQLERKLDSIHRAHPSAGRWLDYPVDATVNKFLSRIAIFEAQRSLLIAAIALQRHQLRHGAYPAELAALAPDFVRRLPRDPMDGQPLRYRLNPDGSFLLYSVGPDGEDNGGDPVPAPTEALSGSQQWWRGRDVVWPWPATAEMVKAYFDKERSAREKKPPSPLTNEAARAALAKRYGLRASPPSPGTNAAK